MAEIARQSTAKYVGAMGWFVISRLALATINLSTKFEVTNSTHYKDMKGDTKCRKWCGFG